MTEDDLIELGFEKILVTAKESGNRDDYYYYNYKLNDDINLVSTDNTESGRKSWKVSVDYWGEIDNSDDVLMLINFFKRIEK